MLPCLRAAYPNYVPSPEATLRALMRATASLNDPNNGNAANAAADDSPATQTPSNVESAKDADAGGCSMPDDGAETGRKRRDRAYVQVKMEALGLNEVSGRKKRRS